MAQQTGQSRDLDAEDYEENFNIKHKSWSYADPSTNLSHNRICSSPVDELEETDNEDENCNLTQSVQVQTDKSTLLSLNQDKKIDIKKVNTHFTNTRRSVFDHSKLTELKTVTLKSIKPYENVSVKLPTEVSRLEVFDEYAETDLDQPMDYALCYNESILDEERKENFRSIKNDFPCVEEMIEEEKTYSIKPKSLFVKEPTKNKKELFSNPSKSFREIFNFFKDRDKKKSNIESKSERSKVFKTPVNIERHSEKSQIEQSEKQMKVKQEIQGSQETPLMFSRCSSLGSLTGLEQNSNQDDRSSIVSDISRRTSGITSPTEFSVSPAPGSIKSQLRNQIGCFVKKKIQHLHQERIKACQCPTLISDTSSVQSENNLKKSLVKHSVFEDNLTCFKDESTPTKPHSMAASSLSSLTIDDDYDDELMQKIILNKSKQNIPEGSKITDNRKEPIGESNHQTDSSTKSEMNGIESQPENDNTIEEENDKIADLTSYEEQLLDRCIRRGIAKWTKQNINEIEPFSWDLGLTCRATRTILTSKIRLNSDIDIQNNIIRNRKDYRNNHIMTINNDSNNNPQSVNNEDHHERESQSIDKVHNSYNITYEEHLLDQCIRRGMAKITKRNISDIKPFSWDVDQICLTTRAIKIHNHIDDVHKDL